MNVKLTAEEYELLIDQAPILIWRANLEAKCDYFNGRWLEFTGNTLEHEAGDGWVRGVHPDDLEHCFEHYMENFKARRVFEMEYRLRRHDGDYRWLVDRGAPFYSKNGGFMGYIGSCIDITDKKTAQDELRVAKERELKNLRGLLPICSRCKKVRDSKGYWEKVEQYITEHADVDLSHGICPECAAKLYPQYK